MDVILCFNGLGNQMSQYAFYLRKKEISKSTRLIHIGGDSQLGFQLDKVFDLKFSKSVKNTLLYLVYRLLILKRFKLVSVPIQSCLRLLNFRIIDENLDYNYNPAYLNLSKGIRFFKGGWPSEKYFLPNKEHIL